MRVRKEIIDKIKNDDKLLTEYIDLVNTIDDIDLALHDIYFTFFTDYARYGDYDKKQFDTLQEELTSTIDELEAFEESLNCGT